MSTPTISLQLYTLRELVEDDLAGTLQTVADMGYTHVEPYGFHLRADEYRAALDATGLTCISGHAALLSDADPGAVLDAAEQLGITTLIDPMVPPEQWTTEDDVRATAAKLNAAAEIARDRGLTIGYHNHWWELESHIGGTAALYVLVDALTPDVALEIDTYWVAVGGADPILTLQRLGDRVSFIHVKDGPGTLDTTLQVAVGDGIMPIADILAAAPQAHRVIELDDYSGDILIPVRRSLEFVRSLP